MNDATNIFELYMEMTDEPTMTVNYRGTKTWMLHGKLHRIGAPAIEYANGTRAWWMNDMIHRGDGPAIEHIHGNKEWYWKNKRHRTNGAAVEYIDGNKEWWVNGREYDDVDAWAKAALKYEHKPASPDDVDAKVAEVMQQDLFD